MPLIATWGGALSNSYTLFTEANSWITTSLVEYAAWTSLTSLGTSGMLTCEAALMEGARDIDGFEYIGNKYFFDQRLKLPRALPTRSWYGRTQVSSGLYEVSQYQMQDDVKRANAAQALWILRYGGRNQNIERIMQGIESISEALGPIKESVKYKGTASLSSIRKLSPDAMFYLKEWMVGRRINRA